MANKDKGKKEIKKPKKKDAKKPNFFQKLFGK